MSEVKGLCERISGFRHPRPIQKLAVERSCQRLVDWQTGSQKEREPFDTLLARIDLEQISSAAPKDLKRLLEELWEEPELSDASVSIVQECSARHRKSFDRRTVQAYLAGFPQEHPAFQTLLQSCKDAAGRHDWPWKQRADRWRLWEPDHGPKLLAQELLNTPDPALVLREAGLGGDLSSGAFVKAAVKQACFNAVSLHGNEAEEAGLRLIHLFERVKGADEVRPMLAYALLAPWVGTACSEGHQRKVMACLIKYVGDPRLKGSAWAGVTADARSWMPDADTSTVFGVLRRWLVQATFRRFFEVVAGTTDRPDQWQERTAFWLQYLDAGVISDAWFAFGSMAERIANSFLKEEEVPYARIQGQGADPSHSALVFAIGDLRVAEWSHNGSTRFWRSSDPKALPLYEPIYFGYVLRAMHGGDGFQALPHHTSWQWRFAKHIHRETGIPHPKYGSGW